MFFGIGNSHFGFVAQQRLRSVYQHDGYIARLRQLGGPKDSRPVRVATQDHCRLCLAKAVIFHQSIAQTGQNGFPKQRRGANNKRCS